MDKENELLYSEIKNPIYQALENQLRLEFEWACADKNLYSISWIALHRENLSDEEFRKLETLLNDDLGKMKDKKTNSLLNTEFILGLCFAAEVFHRKGKVSTRLIDSLNSILSEAKKRNWLNNHEFASLVLSSLSNINEFNEITQIVMLWVTEKYKEFIRDQDYEKVIDCFYGLVTKQTDLELEEDILQEIMRHIDKVSDETLAKLCIILKNRESAIICIRELERRLEEEFKGSLEPSLERGLREIISLMNSACSQETVKSIIDAKRKEGQSWVEDISMENKNIIIKRPPELDELPKVNPKFHALALRALNIHNRSSVVMLNKYDFLRVKEVFNISKKDHIGIRKKEYYIILLITGITSFFTSIFLPEIVLKIFNLNYQQIISYVQKLPQDLPMIITEVIKVNPVLGFSMWCWIWLIRILYSLREGGELSISKLIKLMPVFGDIIKKFLVTEGDSLKND
ncbi:MAG: hypothetical protein ACP5KW_08515 [Thermoproteota archaeon]